MERGIHGAEYHAAAFVCETSLKPQGIYHISRGWENEAIPKAVKLLEADDLKLKRKSLTTISVGPTLHVVVLNNGESMMRTGHICCASTNYVQYFTTSFLRACKVIIILLRGPYLQELLATVKTCVQLIDEGVIGALSRCLDDGDETVRERAAHNLDMIIEVAGSKGCERLLSDGLLDKIVSLLRDNSVSVRTAGYQVLINACARSPQIQRDLCAMDGMIEYLLTETESEKHAHAARALCLIQYCLTSEDPKVAVR